MKKKLFALVFALLLMIPVFSLNAKEKEKVRVYIFEAGGCPYCEEEIKYLESLDSFNKKFVIEKRELYVDHVDWAKGRDYELGKAVAEKFIEDGFENAAYNSTPFVVISDVYAVAGYSTDLESYINKAYKEGDEDVVDEIAKKLGIENVNRDDIGKTTTPTDETNSDGEKPNALIVVGALVLLVGAMAFIIKTGNKNNEENDEVEEDKAEEKVEEDKKEEVVVEKKEKVKEVKKEKPVTKKTQSKTSTAKKSTAKKTTNTKRKTNKK